MSQALALKMDRGLSAPSIEVEVIIKSEFMQRWRRRSVSHKWNSLPHRTDWSEDSDVFCTAVQGPGGAKQARGEEGRQILGAEKEKQPGSKKVAGRTSGEGEPTSTSSSLPRECQSRSQGANGQKASGECTTERKTEQVRER